MRQTMGDPDSRPRPGERPGRARVRVVAAVVWSRDRLLLTQRPPGGPLGLQWEFPGGKIEPGESPERALVREIREELGVAAQPVEVLATSTHDYSHGLDVELIFIRCTLDSLDFRLSREVHAVRWVAPRDLDLREVLAADRPFLIGLGARSERP
jgi:mutator protein MutT